MDLYWFLVGGVLGWCACEYAKEQKQKAEARFGALEALTLPAKELPTLEEIQARQDDRLASAIAEGFVRAGVKLAT